MKKRFYVERSGIVWCLWERLKSLSGEQHSRVVQSFPTRKEARKWAKLANHPHASLAWGNTGNLISVQIADGAMGAIHHA